QKGAQNHAEATQPGLHVHLQQSAFLVHSVLKSALSCHLPTSRTPTPFSSASPTGRKQIYSCCQIPVPNFPAAFKYLSLPESPRTRTP
uniref:Uncharacterized protein n=1 Tax=Crocodylus porosus TaxID=8502 RepID=A0A7M4EIT2_CROPO